MREIEVTGTYSNTGHIIGELHKHILKKIEEKVIESIRVEDEKIKRFEKHLEKFPFLIEEISNYCKGADISFKNLLKLKLGNYKIPEISCTSLFSSSEFYNEKAAIAMKIRDELPLPQYICKKKNEDKIPYFFSGSIPGIGYSFFINEKGFLGINNTGSFLKDELTRDCGFDDCDILRAVAESCDGVDEAIGFIKKLHIDRIVGYTGKKRGMIFLFSEREKASLVELNSFELNHKTITYKLGLTNDFLLPESEQWIRSEETEGTKSSRFRKKRLDEIFDENEKLSLWKLIWISRDKKYYPYSICRDTSLMPVRTVSVFISILHASPVLWICLGQPYTSPFFPFLVRGTKILDKFVSGEISIKLNKIFEKKCMNDDGFLRKLKSFEKKLSEKFEKIQDIDEKNIDIQKDVYKFIMEVGNEDLYNSGP